MFYIRPLRLAIAIVAMGLSLLSLMVLPGHAATVMAQLSWTAPTKNADGSSLTDLAGYKIYYRLATGSYGSPAIVTVGTSTSSQLSGLTVGVQYFIAIKAYDTSGNESAFSAEVPFPVSQPPEQPPPQQPPPSSGLVAAYSFNEGSGTIVNDNSGNGNNGTISGASWTTNGRSGRALYFDGNNDRVTIPDSLSLDLVTSTNTTHMTLEAWVYPTAISSWRTVIAKGTSGNLVYYLYANSSSNTPVVGGRFSGTSQSLAGTTQLRTNVWTHLAATYDGSRLRLYVDGVQVSSRQQTGQMQLSSGVLRIGGNGTSNQYFRGRIDEVRIYNRALTSTEIQAHMSNPVGSTVSNALTAQSQGIQLSTSSLSSTLSLSTTPLSSAKQQTTNSFSASNATSATTATTTTSDLLTSDHLEVGEVAADLQWKRVDFSKPFTDPVVVAKAISARDATPAVVGIRQVDATGFELRLGPWAESSQSPGPGPETVGYLVIERGSFHLADGTSVESGIIDTNAAHPTYSLAFAQPFQSAPVVLTALVNIPDQMTVTGWPTHINEQGFQFQLQPQGTSPHLDAVQGVGYVAWERSTGTIGGLTFEVDRAAGVTPGQFSPLIFKEAFADPPVFLADVQSSPGGSPINVRWEHKDVSGVDVTIDDVLNLPAGDAMREDGHDVGYLLIH